MAAIRKQWRMVIRGKHYPRPILTWSQCGLNEKIMHVITKLGYEKPFPIQSQVGLFSSCDADDSVELPARRHTVNRRELAGPERESSAVACAVGHSRGRCE